MTSFISFIPTCAGSGKFASLLSGTWTYCHSFPSARATNKHEMPSPARRLLLIVT